MTASPPSFRFGRNWLAYAETVKERHVQAAMLSLQRILGRQSLSGLTVLDIGCGSGLFSIAALRLGADSVMAIDADSDCVRCTRRLAERFAPGAGKTLRAEILSVLDPALSGHGTFDVAYSWGVLHHTGALWKAVEAVVSRVKPGGLLALALYNKTRSNQFWLYAKRFYAAPTPVKAVMNLALWCLTVAARLFKGVHPFYKHERGMSVWYDTVDWLGGLPYEWASVEEVVARLSAFGFTPSIVNPVKGFRHGCNEFLFEKSAATDTLHQRQ